MQSEMLLEPGASSTGSAAESPGVYTLAEHSAFTKRLMAGEVAVEELKATFARAYASRDSIQAELSAKTLKQLAPDGTGGRTKVSIVSLITDRMLQRFHTKKLCGIGWDPMSEKFHDAIKRAVEEVTEADLREYLADIKQRSEEHAKALENPQTRSEFERFISYRTEKDLTPEQRRRWDTLQATDSRADRKRYSRAHVVEAVGNLEGVEMTLREIMHTKKNVPVYLVQLSARVERSVYNELNGKAKALGGYFSSYGQRENHGFLFFEKDNAEQFANLKTQSADRSEFLEGREAMKKLATAERFRALADAITERATEKLNADRKTNTSRRAAMANSAEAAARYDLETANILRNLAQAHDAGNVVFLSEVWAKSHVETLRLLARRAMWDAVRADEASEREARNNGRVPRVEDMDFAAYPWPHASVSTILKAWNELRNKPGFRLLSVRLAKHVNRYRKQNAGSDWICFSDGVVSDWLEFIDKAKAAGFSRWDVVSMEDNAATFKQLRAMNIHTVQELRCALRELFEFRGKPIEADPITKALRALVGVRLDGYFPTPPAIVQRMIEAAGLRPDFTGSILEPSAGAGHIADALAEQCPQATVSCVECSPSLRAILEAKGHKLVAFDFLGMFPTGFDAVFMNPPFEDLADTDHVRHAFEFLNPGGTLVAIMAESPFFHQSDKAVMFRNWLDDVGGISEKLPAGSFLNSDRPTGVNTRLVVITK